MATKSAGRVSIRVLPDSTRFKRDLETSLRRIERSMQVKIPVELELRREQLAKLKRQIESLVIKIKPTIELNVSAADIAQIKAKIEAMRPVVNVQLNTIQAATRIANLTRDRQMNIHVRALGLNSLASKLGALSGFNVLLDTFRAGGEFISNIDRHAVQIGKLATVISGAFAGLVGLIGGVGIIGNDLAKLGGIALLGPAFGAGLGIGITTLVLGLKDMKTVLGDLGPKFSDLQDKMSKKFWEEAEKPVRSLVDNLFPTLKIQLQETSRIMGGMFGEFANQFKENATPERVTKMFERMHEAMQISKGAIGPLTRAMINLGEHGSKYFSRFSQWIVDLSVRFDNFIAQAAADGRLDKWTEDAIQGFKDVGRVIASTTRILGSIGRAAASAGYGGLSGFADALDRIEKIMNGERFQKAMSTVFAGLLPTLEGIKRGFLGLGPSIESFLPTYERVMVKFGSIFEQIFGFISTFLENPEFQKGFDDFIGGIDGALRKLGPAMDPLATSLGGVMTLMGNVLERVGGLVADMAIKLGPEFDKILAAITPLLDPLNKLATNLIDHIKPVLSTLATDILPPLVTALSNVFPWIDKIVGIISPTAVFLLKEFGKGLKTMLESIGIDEAEAERVLNFLERLGDNLSKQDFDVPDLGGGNTPGGLGQKLAFKFAIALGTESPLAVEYFKWLDKNMTAVKNGANTLNFIQEAVQTITDPVKMMKALVTAAKNIQDFFDTLGKTIDTILEIAEREIKKKFQQAFKRIFGFGSSGEGVVPAEIIDGGGMGTGGAGGASKGVGGKIEKAWGLDDLSWIDRFGINAGIKFTEVLGGIGTTVDTNSTTIKTTIASMAAQAYIDISTWLDGSKSKTDTDMGSMSATTDTKAKEMGSSLGTFVAENKPKWDTFWDGLNTILTEKWGSMTGTTGTNIGTIAGDVIGGIERIKSNWGPGWELVRSTLQTAWDRMTGNTRSGVDDSANEAGQLPQKAKDKIGATQWTLESSGKALVEGFASGMNQRLGWVESAAIAVAAMVAKHMPHSPAKAGPLSGNGYTTHSGRALVSDLASGMMDNMNKVRSATRKVAEAAQLGSFIDLENDISSDGVSIDRRSVVVNNYNPVAEPSSKTVEKSSNAIRMAVGF